MLRNVISKPKAGTCREKAYKIINFLTFFCVNTGRLRTRIKKFIVNSLGLSLKSSAPD